LDFENQRRPSGEGVTLQERAEFLKMYILTAAYYRERLPDEVLRMYVEDLQDLPAADLKSALIRYRKDRKNRRTPMPADLISILNPSQNEEDNAAQIAAIIVKTVGSKGYNWSMPGKWKHDGDSFPSAVIKECGTAGWAVIQTMGGWNPVCDFVDKTLPSVAMAQIRGIALSLLRRAAAGKLGEKPELPQSREESKAIIEAIDHKRNTTE
jgi:hypothetical protein